MVDFIFESVDECPVCGGAGDFDISVKDKELDIVLTMYSCKVCGASYQNPRMSQNSMTEYYKSGTYRTFKHRSYDPYYKVQGTNNRIDFLERMLEHKPKRCLDVGCAQGYMVKFMHERWGAEVIGYDVYDDPQAFVDVVRDKDKITGKFDLVTCSHVLEHLYNPLEEMEWMASLLNEGGVLFAEVPMERKITVPHVIYYSREAMAKLVNHAKLQGLVLIHPSIQIGMILAKRDPWDIQKLRDVGWTINRKADEDG